MIASVGTYCTTVRELLVQIGTSRYAGNVRSGQVS